MAGIKEKLKNFKMPHTYVILITIMALVLVLTHIIPAGQYERVEDPVSGKNIVVADSFEYVDDVDATAAALKATGVDTFMAPEKKVLPALFGGLENWFFTGPSGEQIELLKML